MSRMTIAVYLVAMAACKRANMAGQGEARALLSHAPGRADIRGQLVTPHNLEKSYEASEQFPTYPIINAIQRDVEFVKRPSMRPSDKDIYTHISP
ncbi:hypothetical protein NDU88_010929 [Pleurodeles waltl]|uniref:Uncharacterized protein n=1 Tax=Pleurodeles waltl TaxID=8319 RepID=A0AAV7PZ93_PLEWA|nr:hypothetical protein NDU88_010929 [Pleurodeles waltl]